MPVHGIARFFVQPWYVNLMVFSVNPCSIFWCHVVDEKKISMWFCTRIDIMR